MNTCGTCKYRGKPIMKFEYETFTQQETSYFLCERIKHYVRDEEELDDTDRAYVIDGSGYYAALCVDNDFGCNQWEGK